MRQSSLTLLFLVSLTLLGAGTLSAQVCGDCNSDGAVGVLDALLGAQHAAALVTLVQKESGDSDHRKSENDES